MENSKSVRGIHLHKSLSGEYIKEKSRKPIGGCDMNERVMNHVLKIDQHQPFTTNAVQRLVDYVKPEFLVHEFMYSSMEEWSQRLWYKNALARGKD